MTDKEESRQQINELRAEIEREFDTLLQTLEI